jgi:hypothetical protein
MSYIEDSQAATGYRVKLMHKPAFKVTGFTLIVPPKSAGIVPAFWDELLSDGRVEKLRAAAPTSPWVLGLGSWDPACEKHGSRYTICIEETEWTDFTGLAQDYPLFTTPIGESDWMCFEMTQPRFFERFWRDNPYKMLKKLGYQFHTREGDFSVGLHFDAYPPGYDPQENPLMEFWITVKEP